MIIELQNLQNMAHDIPEMLCYIFPHIIQSVYKPSIRLLSKKTIRNGTPVYNQMLNKCGKKFSKH